METIRQEADVLEGNAPHLGYDKNATSRFLAFFLTLVLTACSFATAPDRIGLRQAPQDAFAVPFLYRGLGAGAQPRLGIVQLDHGKEVSLVSRALLEALQEMEMSIVDPPLTLENLIPEGESWRTGVTSLAQPLIARYNEEYPDMALPLDRIYGIQYEGSYIVENKELRFSLKSHLYHRGLSTEFRPFGNNEYASKFFFQQVRDHIESRLLELSAQEI